VKSAQSVDKISRKKTKSRKPGTKPRKNASPSDRAVATKVAKRATVQTEYAVPVYEVRGVSAANPILGVATGLWGRAVTQWQLGDWQGFTEMDLSTLEQETERAQLAALAACAHIQLGNKLESRRFLSAASRWGCPRHFFAQVLVAGVQASLARYHARCGHEEKMLRLTATSAGLFGGDGSLFAKARLALSLATSQSAPPSAAVPLESGQVETEHKAFKEESFTLEEAVVRAKNEPSPFKTGITSYAQNFEDVMLWRALGHIENGFYIDIGAQHPVVDSVSKAFYERGWRGIHVEATQAYAYLLRKDRPDEVVIQAAVSDRHGTLTFYEIPDTGMSTGDVAIAEMHRAKGFTIKQTLVPTITLADILALAGHREIHWLKIDVEGMEKRVLQGLARVENKPWVLVIESTVPNSQLNTHGDWEEIVLIAGYEFAYKDGLSRFYLHKRHSALSDKLNLPPNVFDMFIRY
jgi:FkbM family methyltransferase